MAALAMLQWYRDYRSCRAFPDPAGPVAVPGPDGALRPLVAGPAEEGRHLALDRALEDELGAQAPELAQLAGTADPIEQEPVDGILDLDAGGYSSIHGVVSSATCQVSFGAYAVFTFTAGSGRHPPPTEEDLAKGILEEIDMDAYGVEKQAMVKFQLADEDAEIDPVSTAGGGGVVEPLFDRLSNILAAFNDQFGNITWTDKDRVNQLITTEIPARVAADGAYQNAMANSDKQNARIEHDKALGRVMTAIVKDDTELFRQFADIESFRRWLTDTVFQLTYPGQAPSTPARLASPGGSCQPLQRLPPAGAELARPGGSRRSRHARTPSSRRARSESIPRGTAGSRDRKSPDRPNRRTPAPTPGQRLGWQRPSYPALSPLRRRSQVFRPPPGPPRGASCRP